MEVQAEKVNIFDWALAKFKYFFLGYQPEFVFTWAVAVVFGRCRRSIVFFLSPWATFLPEGVVL